MWRNVLAVLLLPSLLQAQQQALAQQGSQLSVRSFQPSYQTFTQRETIRRGTTEKAAIVFILGNDSFVSLVSPRNPGAKGVPLTVEFDSVEGITVSDLAFPPDKKSRMTLQGGDVRVLPPNGTLHFRVKASPDAPLGDRVLTGKLKYQLADANGLLQPQETEIKLPLRVVDQDASVRNSSLYKQTFGRDSQAPPLWLWFSLPILIPLILVMVVVCGIRGEDCSC